MKFKIVVTLLFQYVSHVALAQTDSAGRFLSEWHSYFSIDTMKFDSRKIKVVYTLERTNNLKDNFLGKGDLIFNDSVNKISKLFIIRENNQIDSMSTIPIDNVIIDDSKELILCLSKAEVSPYHILLYDFSGKLLYKKNISMFELVLDSLAYIKFKTSFPIFYNYAVRQKQILKTDSVYYVDLAYWNSLSDMQREKIKASGWLKTSHYFKVYPENFDGTLPVKLSKYANFYSSTDPFYEYEFRDVKPISIILNDEFGGKVKIPLYGYINK